MASAVTSNGKVNMIKIFLFIKDVFNLTSKQVIDGGIEDVKPLVPIVDLL